MALNDLLNQAKQAADKLKDQSQESAGFERQVPAAGPCFGRFIGYVEIGDQKPRGQDKFNKGARPTAILEFQLLGKKHAREIEVDGKKKTVYPVHREFITLSTSGKSWSFKLFKAMSAGRDIKHFAFMLGEAFKFTVIHNESGEGKDKKVFANIRDESGWKVGAPMREISDDEGNVEVKPVAVPEMQGVEPRLLLWDAPTKEQWESIFIDGTHTRKVNGKDEEVSNNWIQQQAVNAENFKGSGLEALLAELGDDLPPGPSTNPDDGLSDDEGDEEGDLDDAGAEGTGEAKGGPTGQKSASAGDDDEFDPLADFE